MIIAKERKRHIVVSDYYIIKPYYTEWHRPVLSASGLRKFGAQMLENLICGWNMYIYIWELQIIISTQN